MKELTVGEFKTHFSEVLDMVNNGEEVVVCFGRKKKAVAVLVPYDKYMRKAVTLGVLEGSASYRIREGFEMTDEELLNR